MGGYGSGSGRSATRVEDYLRIDLAMFKKDWGNANCSGRLTWQRGGAVIATAGYAFFYDRLVLEYSIGEIDDRQHVKTVIPFSFTEQPLGGRRRWFVCRSCGARCRVLLAGYYFRCRHCYGATYESQYKRIRLKGLAKVTRLRERLGGTRNLMDPWPDKPTGMHWKTYRKLSESGRETLVVRRI